MIVASKESGTILKLVDLETYSSAKSVGLYNIRDKSFFTVLRGHNNTISSLLSQNKNMYQIIKVYGGFNRSLHIQPAELYKNEHMTFLWMEGDLTHSEIKKLQSEGQTEDKWQVRLLLKHLLGPMPIPVGVDGKFACLFSDGLDMYAFRNEFGSLFVNDQLTVCTRPFSGSATLPANKVYRIDFEENKFVSIGEFETVHKMEI